MELARFLDKKAPEEFSVNLLLEIATGNIIALPNKYDHYTSLYKYGCSACSSKARNLWNNICDIGKKNASSAEYTKEKVQWFIARIDQIVPRVRYKSDEIDILRCEHSDVALNKINDFW